LVTELLGIELTQLIAVVLIMSSLIVLSPYPDLSRRQDRPG
jgi:hypothetical protein